MVQVQIKVGNCIKEVVNDKNYKIIIRHYLCSILILYA